MLFLADFTCNCHLRRNREVRSQQFAREKEPADLTIDFHVFLSQAIDDVRPSHVNIDDLNNTYIHSESAGQHGQPDMSIHPSSTAKQSKVPDRHSPPNGRVICSHERAAPAALALTGACIRPHLHLHLLLGVLYACTMHALRSRADRHLARVLRTYAHRRRDLVSLYLLHVRVTCGLPFAGAILQIEQLDA